MYGRIESEVAGVWLLVQMAVYIARDWLPSRGSLKGTGGRFAG
jgi:hypothetical protein